MPHKAFLKKKSLLDRFKDSHKATGFIQSARAEHTWNNPLTRRKRTKELNGWIKSFAGKRHIHKLARFNAMQAGKNESAEYNVDCLRYGSTLELPNGVCVKVKETIRCPRRAAFIFRVLAIVEENDGFVIHGFYPVYGLERRPSEEFDLHSDDATALVLFIENNVFNSRGESMQHKLTIKLHETKFDPSQYDFFIASYTLNGNDRSKTTNGIVDAQGTLEDAQKHGATNLKLVGVKDNDKTEIPMESLGISAHKDEAMSLKGFLEALEEKLVKQFDLDEDEVKNYLDSHTQEMQELLDDKELSLKEKVLFVRSEITGEKDESKEPTEEKLGYEKGHKNSKGEDAPWVIRSHEDNRILASFATEDEAKKHLQRMKQYSKGESKKFEGLSNEKVKDAIKFAATEAGLEDYLKVDSDGAMSVTVSLPINSEKLKTVRWVIDSNEGTIEEYLDTEKNLVRDFTDDQSLVSMLTLLFQTARMSLRHWLPKKSEALFNKEELEEPVKSYISDVFADLVVSFHWGEDGAKKFLNKYNDVILANYAEGEMSAYETARYIDRKENPYPLESKKKQESKKNEGHLDLVDTIVVPKWLWDAFYFADKYGETLNDDEEEILADFKAKYADAKYHLETPEEEADFRSHNDFDNYGGPCYDINVYEWK